MTHPETGSARPPDRRMPLAGADSVRHGRVARGIGFGLGGLMLVAAGLQQDVPPWQLLVVAVIALGWPQLAHAHGLRAGRGLQAERHNRWVDAALAGLACAAVGFDPFLTTLLVVIHGLGPLLIGGLRPFVVALAMQAAAALAGVLLFGLQPRPAAGPWVLATGALFASGGLLSIAWRVRQGASRQRQALRQARRSTQIQRSMLDQLDASIVLYDSDDRLVMANSRFRDRLQDHAEHLAPGTPYDQLARQAVRAGHVLEARVGPEAWLQQRLQQRDAPHAVTLRDDRWERIVDRRLADGSRLSLATDVTELVHQRRERDAARRDAHDARARLIDAIEALPDGFVFYDADDRLVLCNQRYRDMYPESAVAMVPGATFEQILRHGLAQGQYPAARADPEGWLADRLRAHRACDGALVQELPGNRWLQIQERRTHDGGIVGFRTDVTDLKRRKQDLTRVNQELAVSARELAARERLLSGSLRRFELALSTGHVWSWQPGDGGLELPRVLIERLGASGFDDGGDALRWLAFVDPQHRAELMAQLDRLLTRQQPLDIELRALPRDRSTCWMHLRGHLVRDELGAVESVVGTVFEVTAMRLAQEAVHEREQQLSGIVETAMDAIITVDVQQRVRLFNRAAGEMFGIDPQQAIGQPLERFLPLTARAAHAHHVAGFARGLGAAARPMSRLPQLTGLRANGREFPIEASIARYEQGGHVLMTAVVRDISDRHEAERARTAQIATVAANQAKTDFISRLSHELRTPMNAVMGFLQLLDNPGGATLSAERRARFLQQARMASNHLLELIDDLLDLSRIEAGGVQIRMASVDAHGPLDAAFDFCQQAAVRQGVDLQPAYRGAGPTYVRADPLRLRQVVINLLTNAIKYNRPGGHVAMQLQAGAGRVRIAVADSGLGMTAEQQARLFEPFNRLGREGGDIEGSGVGLVVVRQLIERMDGLVEVDSTPGIGTTVTVDLAGAAPPKHALPEAVAAGGAGDADIAGQVLYIEDNPVNVVIVEEFLLHWPRVTLDVATTGTDGIGAIAARAFDLVLLDMELPDMTGLDVLQRLRAQGRLQAGLRVVMLSASAMPDNVRQALDAGATAYWTKPLDHPVFLRRMAALLSAGPALPAGPD
jgi:PAS domain S-box-containing protein